MSQNKRKVLNKWVITMVALLLIVSVLSACGKKDSGTAASGKPTDVIATYKENGKVTRGELDSFINVHATFVQQYKQMINDPAFQQEMLKRLISFKVLSARVDDTVKAEADKLVAEQLKQATDDLTKREGGMEKQLKDNHVELKDIESLLKMNVYTMSGLESKITDQQVQEAYKTHSDNHDFDIVTVSHILISIADPATQKEIRTKDEALARANQVLDKLKKGGDFTALAKEYSDDPGSKDTGGIYKDADANQFDPAFRQAAIELPLNKLSEPPVESSFGYHVMKVEKRAPAPLETVKAQVKASLTQASLSEFAQKELPGLIETNNLPTPTPEPTAAPSASPAVSPAASPAISPSASPAAK